MAINIDKKGTIFLHQGDSGDVVIQGISDDRDYRVYFAIKDKNRRTIGEELFVNSNYNDSVTFFLSSSLTDLLVVPDGENYTLYTYGIKICDSDIEDTLFVSGGRYGDENHIIVFPKKVEGVYV